MTRSNYIDNIKGLLMFTVVFTHMVMNYRTSPVWGGIINVVYSFHMPAFILVSGYLSKRVDSHRKKELDTLLWPFIVFQILYFAYCKFTGLLSIGLNPFSPIYLNWYIIVLFLWRLVLPYFKYFSKTAVISSLFVLSALSGAFVDNSFLSMYRMLYYFPLFAIGYYITDLDAFVRRLSVFRWLFVFGFLIGIAVIFYLSFSNSSLNEAINYALTPNLNYDREMKEFIEVKDVMIRLCGFVTTVLMTFGFIVTCCSIKGLANRVSLLSDTGRNSIAVYYIHGFVALFVMSQIGSLSVLSRLGVVLPLTILLCWLLSRDWVVRLLKPLFDFNNVPKFTKKG